LSSLYINKRDLKRFENRLTRLLDIDKIEAQKALFKFSNQTERDIKKDAPVDTGNLRQNVKQYVKPGEVTITSRALTKDNFDYAIIQEFGSVFRSPKPYFYPNVRKNFLVLIDDLGRRIKRALR
jgi:hypothetical protein